MNTKSLQKEFKSDYEEFFSKNDMVVSGCFTGPLSPSGMGHRSQSLRIKLKLPIKMYLGVNSNKTDQIKFEKVSIYNNVLSRFDLFDFNQIVDRNEQIIEFIKKFLKENNKEQGLILNIISEGGRGYSLSFSANFSALLSIALYLLIGKISSSDLEDYDKFTQSDIFGEIETTSWQIELISRYGNASGDSISVLNKGHNPGLFYCEGFDSDIDIDKVKELKYSFTPFSKLFNLQDKNYLPFDYAIVFGGLPRVSHKADQTIKLDEKKLNKYADFVYDKILPVTKLDKNVHFLDILNKGIYNQFVNMFSIYTVMILESFEKLYTEGSDNKNIEHLIDTINSVRYLFYMLQKGSSDFVEIFSSVFQEESKNKEKIGIVNSYSSKLGGSFMMVMKHGTNRNYFFETIQKLKSDYPDIKLSYASRIDGIIDDGVQIEQHITSGLFSGYIQKDRVYVKSNNGSNYVGEYNEAFATHKQGLLLDTISNKIYLDGRKLNSSDIPSQTTTINIIDKLLDSIGKDVSNKELEISSYSKNKNEMIGKIVIPIVSLLEKETGKQLPLICKGSIYDFYVKLNASDISISVIKKL